MPVLFYREHQIPYTLKSSRRRRTLALQVDQRQQVTLFAPERFSGPSMDRFLRTRAEWVLKKLKYFAELALQYPPKTYRSGESFLIQGEPHVLEALVDPLYRRSKVERLEGKLVVRAAAEDKVREAVRRWYKGEAATRVREAAERLAPPLGVQPKQIRIANQKRRWGSCSSLGHLRFNWRVAMMPAPVLDYIVAHELAHLKVQNHSARFWSRVRSILPDYESRRAWLRANNARFASA